MPLYNCASTAAALDVPAKWLDNILSHNNIDGVTKARQGIPRRLSTDAIAQIALAYTIHTTTGVPVANALTLAARLLESPSGTLQLAPALTLSLNRAILQASITDRLASAIEVTPTPKRGRPRGR